MILHATRLLSRNCTTGVSQGAGALVRRSIGSPELRNLTPFLMLDHFHIAKGGVRDLMPLYCVRCTLTDVLFLGFSGPPTSWPGYGHLHYTRCQQTRGLCRPCGYHSRRRRAMDVRGMFLYLLLSAPKRAIVMIAFDDRAAEVSISNATEFPVKSH